MNLWIIFGIFPSSSIILSRVSQMFGDDVDMFPCSRLETSWTNNFFLFKWNCGVLCFLKFFNITRIFSTLSRALSWLFSATLINSSSCENFKLLQEVARNEKVKNFFQCLFFSVYSIFCVFPTSIFLFNFLISPKSADAEVLRTKKGEKQTFPLLFHWKFSKFSFHDFWWMTISIENYLLLTMKPGNFQKIFKTFEMNFNYVSKNPQNSHSLKFNFVFVW